MSGGYQAGRSVEVLYANGSRLCSLPDLPYSRQGHTQDGLTACGGFNTDNQPYCHTLTLADGQWTWTQSHSLITPRRVHTSWSVNDELIIIGGKGRENSTSTSEALTPENPKPITRFPLKYDTW